MNVKRWLNEISQNCDSVCKILGQFPTVELIFFSVSGLILIRPAVPSGLFQSFCIICRERYVWCGLLQCTASGNQNQNFPFSPIVGNKNDDPARKQVDTQDAVHFGESVGVRVFETSAKENINVEEVTPVIILHKYHFRHIYIFFKPVMLLSEYLICTFFCLLGVTYTSAVISI